MKKSNLRFAVSTFVVALAAVPGLAHAQVAGFEEGAASNSEEDQDAGEIVVTAQGRSQQLRNVPVSVSVTTGENLSRNNVVSLQDLSSRLPNIRVATAPASNILTIRGVGSGINMGFEQAVGTFVDGVYRGRSRSSAAALFDLDRVEVLRGPQSTFFGNNVIAGALNITSRKPGRNFGVNASALYSPSDGEYSVEAGLDIPVSESLGLRVAGKLFGMNGYVRNEALTKEGPRNRDAVVRGSLRWEPSNSWRTDLRVDYAHMRDRAFAEGVNCPAPAAYGPPRGTCLLYLNSGQPIDSTLDYRSGGFGNSSEYDMTEVALTNRFELGSVTLSSVSSYFDHDYLGIDDLAPFPVKGIGGTASRTTRNNFENAERYSQELRLTSASDGPLQYMLGAYYAHEKLESGIHVGAYFAPFGASAGAPFTAATPVATFVRFDQKTDNWSVFGSATAELTTGLSLDLGLRYTEVTKTVDRNALVGVGGSIAGPGAFTPFPEPSLTVLRNLLGVPGGNYDQPRQKNSKLLPSIKLSYKLNDDVLTYVSYGKGFKAGGFAASEGKFPFGPETVDAYEFGVKASILDNRVFASLAIFRSEYSDLQEATNTMNASGTIISVITNAARSRTQGIEFAVDAKLLDNLSLRADVAYLDARYRDYPNAACTILGTLTPNCVQDLSGKRRGFSPEFSGNVGLTYTVPVAGLELKLEPLLYFSTSYFQSATADALLSQPGFSKIDFRASVGSPDGKWELAVIGKNLTNKLTASFRNQFAGSPGTFWAYPERSRSIAFQASLKF